MLEEAIAHYHALLDPDTARATQQQLTDEQRARNLFFGERPLMSVLRPRFITADQYALIQRACGLVAGAAQRLAPALLEDATLRADLALTPGEERLIAMHPGYAEPSAHSRMDTFLTVDGTSLQFVEYNAESPAAIAYEDVLSDVVEQLPAMRRFAERYALTQAARAPAPARNAAGGLARVRRHRRANHRHSGLEGPADALGVPAVSAATSANTISKRSSARPTS